MAHTKQQRPDYGIGFQVKVLTCKPLQGVSASLDSGARAEGRGGARERKGKYSAGTGWLQQKRGGDRDSF